jgi:hypothetical protein
LGNLAPGLFAVLLPGLVVTLGFTSSYVFWLALLTLLLVLVGRFMRDAPYFQYRQMGIGIDPDALMIACGEELVLSGNATASLKQAAADWRTWALTFFYFVSFGGFIALTVWLPRPSPLQPPSPAICHSPHDGGFRQGRRACRICSGIRGFRRPVAGGPGNIFSHVPPGTGRREGTAGRK